MSLFLTPYNAGDTSRRGIVNHSLLLLFSAPTRKLTDKLARQALEGVLAGEGSPSKVVAARGLEVMSDDGALIAAVNA
ncbi:Uncharacterised protein [Chlamydia trachomatis]|nr:Uncharacterised protein [Chlamydia trachomatis]